MTPDYYYYLNQSDTYKVDGTDDRSDFSETLVSTAATSAPGNLLVLQIGKPRPGKGQGLAQGHTAKKKRARRGVQVPTLYQRCLPAPNICVVVTEA